MFVLEIIIIIMIIIIVIMISIFFSIWYNVGKEKKRKFLISNRMLALSLSLSRNIITNDMYYIIL